MCFYQILAVIFGIEVSNINLRILYINPYGSWDKLQPP